jgi:hypothetical protein
MPLPDPLPAAVETLRSISPVGSATLVGALGKLFTSDARACAELATAVSAVDSLAGGYRLFGTRLSYWVGPARAWMLHRLFAERIISTNPPGFNPPRPWPEQQQLLAEVGAMTMQGILDSLADAMSGKRQIAALAGAQADQTRQVAARTWDPNLFTPPERHSPTGDFVHLVVGLRRETDIGLATAPPARRDYVATHLSAFINEGSLTYKSAQHYLDDPGILKKSLISASVLTKAKCATYGGMHFGFVLKAPIETIAAASPSDMDMGFDKATRPDMLAVESDKKVRLALISDSFIQGVAALYMRELPARDELVLRTAVNGHNEVAVMGTIGPHSVSVSALFVKTTSVGRAMLAAEHDVDERLWKISQVLPRCADALGVPIIRIPDPNLVAGKTWFHDRY